MRATKKKVRVEIVIHGPNYIIGESKDKFWPTN